MLNPELLNENKALRWSWDQHPAEHLDHYLVQGIEDPRINCQSILTRALIIVQASRHLLLEHPESGADQSDTRAACIPD